MEKNITLTLIELLNLTRAIIELEDAFKASEEKYRDLYRGRGSGPQDIRVNVGTPGAQNFR